LTRFVGTSGICESVADEEEDFGEMKRELVDEFFKKLEEVARI